MTESAQKTQASNAEMAEIIERFEQLYAASGPEEPPAAVAEEPRAEPLFAENEFELPARTEPAPPYPDVVDRGVDEPQHRIEPQMSGETDVEEAFAILRGAEPKGSRPAPVRDFEDKEDDPPPAAAMRLEQRPHALRRYAVPALAATLFVGLATGYVVTRHNEAPASPAAGAPAGPLKMDYSLQQPVSRDALAQQRNTTPPAGPAR